ncbi:MAG: glycosyltransferase family 2 protein [Promethearchaeota archaeon]
MSKVILSVCIPTYNRSNIIANNLKHLIKYPGEDIEIVVSDNASPDDTEIVIKNIKDPRIKYYRNKKNFGVDTNIIKCVERANGEFLFFITDEDIIELKELPWIIEIIKENKNLSQIIGSVVDLGGGRNEIICNFGDRILKPGSDSILELFFKNGYLAGLILKRETLKPKEARKFIGCIYVHQVFMLQAMKKGYSLCTPKILCYMPKKEAKSEIFMFKSYCAGERYHSPLGSLSQLEDRLRIINNLLENYPITQKILIDREMGKWAEILVRSILDNLRTLLKIIIIFKIIIKNRIILKSSTFWVNLSKEFYKRIKSKYYWKSLLQKLRS